MRFRKKYGESRISRCPFCGKIATKKTENGLEVCSDHINSRMQDIKCTCGSWLEQRDGKFGPYFHCINCGNMNFQKAMQVKEITASKVEERVIEKKIIEKPPEKKEKKEITISTDDVEYFS